MEGRSDHVPVDIVIRDSLFDTMSTLQFLHMLLGLII